MAKCIAAFLAGLVFSVGLTVSQMVNPAKVLAFLDVFGDWDPSLALVMGGALLTTLIGYRWVLTREAPIFAATFNLPGSTQIDRPLAMGAIMFGIGWGLVGLCPGPAIAAITIGGVQTSVFLIAMLLGALVHDRTGLRKRLFE